MTTEIAIFGITTIVGLVGWLIKTSFNAGVLNKRVEQLEKELKGLGDKFSGQIEGMLDEIKKIHREIADLGQKLLIEMRDQNHHTNENFVTTERFKDAITKYDVIVSDSKSDRKMIWTAIDDIRKDYISKEEHKTICRAGKE